MKEMYQQPWIGPKWLDTVFILLPPFLCLAVIVLFPSIFQQQNELSDFWWIFLILIVDVGHVYSTLYKTYFDSSAYQTHKTALFIIPLFAFVAMVILYTFSALLFWRILAYVAVFHFIRQQYGFMRIYSRKENQSRFSKWIDSITIYTAGIYPILFWHLKGDRQFHWFVAGDFFEVKAGSTLLAILAFIYFSIILLYIAKELLVSIKHQYLNLPKNAVVMGTLASWYFGIVYFNGDLSFTLLNVVSHGIPYMALIWLYGKKRVETIPIDEEPAPNRIMKLSFGKLGWLLFPAVLIVFAFVEEGLWDLAVWKERAHVFGFSSGQFNLNHGLLSIVVPLLALPQVTHYIVDGFIWRIKKNDLKWTEQAAESTK